MPSTSIQSAVIDGRAHNPRYIERQLGSLHKALTSNVEALQDAIITDSHVTCNEAQLEIFLAISVVRSLYESISMERAMAEEYSVTRGENLASKRDPVGLIYVRPQSHTLLYSVISPLSNAIVGGNCVIIELKVSLQKLPGLLQQILLDHLDQDTFAIVEEFSDKSSVNGRALVLDQTKDTQKQSSMTLQTAAATSRVVAVVDRSADITSAAKSIIHSRASFQGRSPYAPDVVLVNEFQLKDFVDSAVVALTEYLSGSNTNIGSEPTKIMPRRKERVHVLTKEERSDPGTTVILEGDFGSIVRINNRDLSIFQRKITDATLVVHPVTSLDDAIDFANLSDEPLLASYHFGIHEAAKYTTQFIDSHISFVNHIPIELIVGPVAPLGFPASADQRYRPEMFSVPKPIYTVQTQSSKRINDALRTKNGAWLSMFQNQVSTKLPGTSQRDGKVVGFFDQGLITGVMLILAPVVGGVVVTSFYGIRMGLRMMRP
ncbi:Nn.00g029980.m01.CDS01 [Neocucurbitaria sp. VM-36]